MSNVTTHWWPHGKPEWADTYLAGRKIGGGEWIVAHALTLGRGRLSVMTEDNSSVEHWCLDSPYDALNAWLLWPSVPKRWNRHMCRDGTFEYPEASDG